MKPPYKKDEEEDIDYEEENEESEKEDEEELSIPKQKVSPSVKETKKEVKKNSLDERYSLIEIPTQTQLVYKDNSDEKIYDSTSLLCKLANDIEVIKRNLI